MHVAAGHGETARRYAGARYLDAAGVGRSAQKHLALVGQAGALGGARHPVHDAGVGNHPPVAHLDRRAVAQSDFHLDAFGGIARQGDIHGQADVGVDAVGRGRRPAGADFFLHAEDEINLMGGAFQAAQGLDQNGDADAVIHGFGDQAVAQIEEGALEDGHIAHVDGAVGAAGSPHVNEHFLQRGDFAAPAGAFQADDALGSVQEAHVRPHAVARVDAADVGEAYEAFFVHVGGNHADFVQVRREHDFEALAVGAALAGNQVAEGVHAVIVGVRGDFLLHRGADFVLVPRRAGDLGEFLDEGFHGGSRVVRWSGSQVVG